MKQSVFSFKTTISFLVIAILALPACRKVEIIRDYHKIQPSGSQPL